MTRESKPLGLGLIGAGRMGRVHAEIIAREVPEARLIGVADTDLGAAEAVAVESGARPYSDHREMLAAGGFQAVVVATSTQSHAAIIADAAEAGLDVFCEKPIALTMEETRTATDVAARSGVRLQVGLYRRHDADYVTARARIERGVIGTFQLFRSLQYDTAVPALAFCDPASSGGIAVDMGIHEFDLARWLTGDEIVEVHAVGSSVAAPELASVGDVGTCIVTMRFATGAVGSVELARLVGYAEDVRTEVVGTKGSVLVGMVPASHSVFASDGGMRADLAPSAFSRFRPALVAQLRSFCRSVLDDQDVWPTSSDSLAALAAGIAARRSLELGRPVAVSSAP